MKEKKDNVMCELVAVYPNGKSGTARYKVVSAIVFYAK